MFGKLRDKLKNALGVFSTKTEEEAEVVETIVDEGVVNEGNVADEILVENSRKVEGSLQSKVTPEVVQENLELHDELNDEKIIKNQKKGFFSKIFARKEKDENLQLKKPETGVILPKLEASQPEIPTIENSTSSVSKTRIKPVVPINSKPVLTTKVEQEVKGETVIAETGKSEEKTKEKGFFAKVKQRITTKTINRAKFEELFWDLELVLLENNVSVEVIEKIKSDLCLELVDRSLPYDVEGKIIETLKCTLTTILTYETVPLLTQIKQCQKKPFIIAFFGINGAGKTTSVAKLTHYLQKNNLKVVIAACDTFRAAAIQQLEEHAVMLNTKIIKHDYGSDAAAVAFDAIKYAEKNGIEVVLIDTAGRLHSNTNLMAELEKIIRITKPHLKIFVGESITGNDCIEQAKEFNKIVELDGVILTKADVDEKGGTPISISYVIKKPILFLGMGQTYEDLEPFNVDKIMKNLGFENIYS